MSCSGYVVVLTLQTQSTWARILALLRPDPSSAKQGRHPRLIGIPKLVPINLKKKFGIGWVSQSSVKPSWEFFGLISCQNFYLIFILSCCENSWLPRDLEKCVCTCVCACVRECVCVSLSHSLHSHVNAFMQTREFFFWYSFKCNMRFGWEVCLTEVACLCECVCVWGAWVCVRECVCARERVSV